MKKSNTRNYREEPMNSLEAEIAITALHATGEYTVLRKLDLERDPRFTRKKVQGAKIGLCIDTETTGLNHAENKVIELGIVAFEYDPMTAAIIRITDTYDGFEDPGCRLPKEIIDITGITDAMVAGQTFDDDRVMELADGASLVIAHNSAFDRKFVENRYPAFSRLPWACTVSQIDWGKERISSRTLEYLLYKCGGYTINAHRAQDDAEGLLGLLLGNFPVTETPIFKTLLEKSEELTSRICAVGAPYDKKDILKQRGYRWSDGSGNSCKGWWTEVPHYLEPDELNYLGTEIYPDGNSGSVDVKRIDAYTRFSVREA
ncbi:MAG: 3'-5' exonuclease [Desulfuromonadaceae bacterium]|nr:3'-5' exonuclease [Desulfuromonadaceae bacterium]